MLVPAVNVPPPDPFPPIYRVDEPAFRVPAVKAMLPVKVLVNPVPRLSVPPVPLTIRLAPFTLPVKVAVPPVLVIETNPVVAKPAILWVVMAPVITMGELPAVNVP